MVSALRKQYLDVLPLSVIEDHGQKWVDEIKPQSSYIQFKKKKASVLLK